MFVYENKLVLILTEEISRNWNFSNSQSGNGSNPAKKKKKAAFQSTPIFMHAVDIILSTIFTKFAKHCIQTMNIKPFIRVHIYPNICHQFYIWKKKKIP